MNMTRLKKMTLFGFKLAYNQFLYFFSEKSKWAVIIFAQSMQICTTYLKLEIKHILFKNNFWFSIYFSRKIRFSYFLGRLILEISKEEKSKTINARIKNDSFRICMKFWIQLHEHIFYFVLFFWWWLMEYI